MLFIIWIIILFNVALLTYWRRQSKYSFPISIISSIYISVAAYEVGLVV